MAKRRTPSATIAGPVAARPGARAESQPVVLMVGQAARPGRTVAMALVPVDAVLRDNGVMPSVAVGPATLMGRQVRLTKLAPAGTVARLRAVLAAVVLTGAPVWPVIRITATNIMGTLVMVRRAMANRHTVTLAMGIPNTATLATVDITVTQSLPAIAVDRGIMVADTAAPLVIAADADITATQAVDTGTGTGMHAVNVADVVTMASAVDADIMVADTATQVVIVADAVMAASPAIVADVVITATPVTDMATLAVIAVDAVIMALAVDAASAADMDMVTTGTSVIMVTAVGVGATAAGGMASATTMDITAIMVTTAIDTTVAAATATTTVEFSGLSAAGNAASAGWLERIDWISGGQIAGLAARS